MSVQIRWTPRDGATELTLDLEDLGCGVSFEGFLETTGSSSVSPGRALVALPSNSLWGGRLDVVSADRQANPATDDWPFEMLTSWLAHADVGGEFKLIRDSTKMADTTLATALNAQSGSTTPNVDVVSAAGIAAGDFLYLEHLTDKTRWEVMRVSALGSDFDLSEPVSIDYPIGSIVRHWEYFPKCVLSEASRPRERTAGRGNDRWDVQVEIETVR